MYNKTKKYIEMMLTFLSWPTAEVFSCPKKTKSFIDKYHPKRIFVDHFDDAFPPVTREVSVKRLQNTIKKNHPDIEFIIPEICRDIEL